MKQGSVKETKQWEEIELDEFLSSPTRPGLMAALGRKAPRDAGPMR